MSLQRFTHSTLLTLLLAVGGCMSQGDDSQLSPDQADTFDCLSDETCDPPAQTDPEISMSCEPGELDAVRECQARCVEDSRDICEFDCDGSDDEEACVDECLASPDLWAECVFCTEDLDTMHALSASCYTCAIMTQSEAGDLSKCDTPPTEAACDAAEVSRAMREAIDLCILNLQLGNELRTCALEALASLEAISMDCFSCMSATLHSVPINPEVAENYWQESARHVEDNLVNRCSRPAPLSICSAGDALTMDGCCEDSVSAVNDCPPGDEECTAAAERAAAECFATECPALSPMCHTCLNRSLTQSEVPWSESFEDCGTP